MGNRFSLPELSQENLDFPPPDQANFWGVLAVGGDLSVNRLARAYRDGIFPWYSEGEPIQWWSPNPRVVLFPDVVKVSKSMNPYSNQKKFGLSFDRAFREVIYACQNTPRGGQTGTWITNAMLEAFCAFHEAGYAHSVEVWDGEILVGGLYGVAIGKVFFGESMFSNKTNASKFGFISLVRTLRDRGFTLIDCQVPTSHLESLGARELPREKFLALLQSNRKEPMPDENWGEWLGNSADS